MTQESPPSGVHRGWVAAGSLLAGLLLGYAFHELAGLRPFVPPIVSGGQSMACGDLDAYVQHVSDLSDHRRHDAIVGIHRSDTIKAVNELYDRARCQPVRDAAGHETYHQFHAQVVDDVNDPGPPHAALALPALSAAPREPAPAAPLSVPNASGVARRRPTIIDGTLHRHVYTLPRAAAYAAEENQAGTPAGAADPNPMPAPHCGPDDQGVNWRVTGCQ